MQRPKPSLATSAAADQKVVEATGLECERLFRAIFDSAFQFIGLLRPDGSILEINHSALEFGGLKLEEIRGQRFWETRWWSFSPEVQSELKQAVSRAAKGEFVRYETKVRGKGDRLMTIDFSLAPIRDEAGRVTLLVPEGRDITGRKETEQRIQDALSFNQTILRASPVGVVVFKDSGECFSVNEALAKLVGGTVEEIQKQNFRKLKSWKTAGVLEAAEAALSTQSEREVDARFVSTFGKEAWLSFRLVPFRYEGEAHLLALVTDVSWRKQAEEKLRASEHRLRKLMEQAPAAVSISRGGTHIYVNQRFLDLFGLKSADEAIGKFITEHWAPEYQKIILERQRRRLSGETVPPEFEGIAQRKDGPTFPCHVAVAKVELSDGPAFLAFLTDITARRKAEEASQHSHSLLAATLESTADGILVVSRDGKISSWNHRFAEMWLIPKEILARGSDGEALNIAAAQLKTPEMFMAKVRELYANPDAEALDVLEFKDGRVFERYSRPQRLGDEIAGRVWSFHDITERKRTEEALQESRALYHSLVEHMPAGVFRKDSEGRFVFVNSVFCRLRGLKADEILGKNPLELAEYETAKAAANASKSPTNQRELTARGMAHHEQIMRTGKPLEVEESYLQPDGAMKFYHVVKSPIFSADGRVIGSMGMQFDITARKQAEAAQARLAAIVNSSEDAIISKTLDGVITSWNQGAEKLFGHSAAEAVGQPVSMLIPPEVAREEKELLARIRRGESVTHMETLRLRKDRKRISVSITVSPIMDDAGKIVGASKIARDITGRKQLEAQFRQAQKMEAVGQLAGGVAHDFNNILAIIQIQSDLLKSGDNLSPDQRDSVGEIAAATQRAAALTRQLLLFGRKEIMQARDIDLNDCVNNITKMLRRILGEDIQLQFKFAMQSLFIHADAGMMDQVIMNLAVNSRDAMPQGGRLVIETSLAEIDELAASQSLQGRPGSFVCLSVSDTGCGIPRENLTRIFEPFYTTKDVGKGTGLGLATVFGIVQQHQGWINVYSETGRGTTFRVYFPRMADRSGLHYEQALATFTPGGNETILLVEDDAFVRTSVRSALTQLGYHVIDAINGNDAIAIWKENREKINLVLTDLVMPGGMTGKELGEQLQKESPGLKLIYASGYSTEIAGGDFPLEEGVNFLSKPFHASRLAQTVRARLDGLS